MPTELVGTMSAYNNRSHLLSQEGTHGVYMIQLTYVNTIIVQVSLFFFPLDISLSRPGLKYQITRCIQVSDATYHRITSFLHFKRNIALPPHKFACALALICQAKAIGAGQPKLPTFAICQTQSDWCPVNLNFPGERAPND